jgi:hypothetical protein
VSILLFDYINPNSTQAEQNAAKNHHERSFAVVSIKFESRMKHRLDRPLFEVLEQWQPYWDILCL